MPNTKYGENIRNIAIVAHVDHGKTTLVDALLTQSGSHTFKEGEVMVMDSNPLEKERGITIFSKNASFEYKETTFNIVDTPGHADFGSEVERILAMVDGVLLLVDAFDGPMPQTKFVLRKSLELGLKPILVVNKIDRPNARPQEVVDMTFDLFCELGASDLQLDFPVVFCSAKEGHTTTDLAALTDNMDPLLDTILKHVAPPEADPDLPFQMLVTMLDYDSYVGRIAIGRIFHGKVKVGELLTVVNEKGTQEKSRVTKILKHKGMKRIEAASAQAGDIAAITGFETIHVADTLAHPDKPEAIPTTPIDEPTISMTFGCNSSPLSGKDGGKFLTSRHIRERLEHEAMMNVGIRVENVLNQDCLKVSGRGELHLSILIETMRREGYELEVSRPEVIFKKEDGQTLEPIEAVLIEVDPNYQGAVIETLGARRSELKEMTPTAAGTLRMEFLIPARSLMGFRNELLLMTRGTGIMVQSFHSYQPFRGQIPSRQQGVLISQSSGKSVAFALWNLQDRGEIFVRPGDALYDGMIIGINNKGPDLVVNPTKEKKLTNTRAAGADDAIQLTPPRAMTLEFALEFIEADELVEVTPKNIRLRKRFLSEIDRKRQAR